MKKIKIIIRRILDYIEVKKFIKKYTTNDNVYVLNIVPQIGDICYHFSYLGEFRKKSDKRIIVLGVDTQKDLYKCFDYLYDELILISKKQAYKIIDWTRDGRFKDRFNNLHLKQIIINPYIYSYVDFILKDYYLKGSLLEFVCKFGYQLEGNNMNISYPYVQRKDELINMFKSKTVILAPYANSMTINLDFWNELVKQLKKYSITFYTNCFKKEIELENTLRLECSKEDLYNYCLNGNVILIGSRSGIMDFVISTNVKIISVSFNGDFMNLFSLKNWRNYNVEEFNVTEDNCYEVINSIEKYII